MLQSTLEMSWPYLAGLFDGEGYVGLTRITSFGRWTVVPRLAIGSSVWVGNSLVEFYKSIGFYSRVSSNKNPFGHSYSVRLQSWKGVETITNAILPYSIEKHRQLELMLQAIGEYHNGKRLEKYVEIRIKLHALARKGPKILKPWV